MTVRAESLVGEEVLTTFDNTNAADAPEKQVYVFPASREQSRYWILDQLDGASTASNMAIAFRLEGMVDDAWAEQSLRELTRRHEALRTGFRMVDGQLSQVISEEPRFSFSISDLRSLPADKAAKRAEELILEHGRVRIDLANGPTFYAHLIHLTDQDHFLAFTIHHIACDGWSNGVLIRDFAGIYAAVSEDRAISLPELPFQFADFTVWQQQWMESEEASAALAFWREHVRRDIPAVDLPTDRPRSAQKSAPGHIESQLLSPSLTAKLKDYCRQHDATMHQILLAAFEGLISRYTDQTEFLLGSTIANRTQPGMEHVVGRFANPQVILADVEGDPTYRELVARVADWSAKSYAHQDLPFSRLMEEFQLDQSGATSQFLQIYFVYQKAFMQPQQAGALKVIPRPSVSGGVNFDLLVSVVERAEGPRLQIEYNTILFEQQRIQRLIEMYVRVLDAVIDTDSLRVSEFPLLSGEEEMALNIAGRGEQLTEAGTHSIPSWLSQQTNILAEKTAIVAGDQRLRWRELEAKTLEFAAGLRKLGVSRGQTVAVRMEASTDAAAAVWAVLRIGAVVLPIPSSTGEAEWHRVLLELTPTLALAQAEFTERFDTLTSFAQLSKAGRGAHTESESELALPAPSDTAFLNPKCDRGSHYRVIPVSHESVLRSMLGASRSLGLLECDSVLVWSSEASSHALGDLLVPLVSGATIVYANSISPRTLQSVIDREHVGFAFTTPGDLTALLQGGWSGDQRLRLICRGPGTTEATLNRLVRSGGPASPTHWSRVEVLFCSPSGAGPFAVGRLKPGPPKNASPGDSGYIPGEDGPEPLRLLLSPIAGQTLGVVDRHDRLTPNGITGELVVQPSALSPKIRTGYLARSASQGGFEFVESVGRQVRLHGFRLRLSDLENVLYRNSEIATAEATILNSGSAANLAAYVAGYKGKRLSIDHAKTSLSERAPGHLSSAKLIAVDVIPRCLDGTVNFPALPKPTSSHVTPIEDTSAAPPRDELEAKLVKIWEDVLGIRGIGVRTSFFSLGGYSLMIVRLFARINKAMGSSLPITTIFNAPTIEQLADILRGRKGYSSLVPVQPNGTKPPFFLILSYLVYEGLRSALGEDRPFYGLRELDHEREMTLQERASSYVREIRSVTPDGPYYIGGWCSAGPLAVEIARQIAETGGQVAALILFDSWRPGYAAELAALQQRSPEMTKKAILRRKYRFHKVQLARLSAPQKIKYFWTSGKAKIKSSRDRFYLRHWRTAQILFKAFGLPLPHFMHNISRTSFDSAREYQGRSYPGRITLIRATEAAYVPQAELACGWDKVALEGVDVLFAPGSHESMFLEPNLSTLGELLNSCLLGAESPNDTR